MRGIEQIPWLYDALCALCEATGLARWRSWLVSGARGHVLDLGCGTGRNLPLLPAGTRAVALEPSWETLQRARRRAPGVPLVVGSAEALPFRNGAFDTVLSGLVFCSVPDVGQGLREVQRVLRPDGQLRMLEHVRATRAWQAQGPGSAAAGLDTDHRRLPSEPRDRARGRGRRLPDRRREPAGEGQHAAVRRVARGAGNPRDGPGVYCQTCSLTPTHHRHPSRRKA
jgi:SAM-dependent methyltransferase